MRLAELKDENTLASIVVAAEQRTRWESGRHPPTVDDGTDSKCMFVQPACIIVAYHDTLAVQAAFNIANGLSRASRTRAWLRGWQLVTSKRSIPTVLPIARTSGLSLCLALGSHTYRYSAARNDEVTF